MLNLKLQYSSHLMQKTDSLEKYWYWERLKVRGEGDNRGWDGWKVSSIWWTWVWVSLGAGDGQGSLACCSPWGHKELETAEWLNWFIFGGAGSSFLHVGFSLVVANGANSSPQCVGLSLWWLLLLQSMGSRHTSSSSCGSWAWEHRLNSCGTECSCSEASEVFLDQRWNPCLLHWGNPRSIYILSELY